jgi:uncharacterized protein YndB with AHSA1/START domain
MRSVRAEAEVRATPERAIDAFLRIDALRAWWGVERGLVEPHPGGLFALAWKITEHGFGFVTTGVIEELDPQRRLVIGRYTYFHPERSILGPMTLTVEAEPRSPRSTLVRVTQDGYRDGADWDWYHDSVRVAWPQVVTDVAAYLERTA